MTLVDKLLMADKSKLNQIKTETIRSERLSELTGEEIEIEIQQIPARRMGEINAIMYDENGNQDMTRVYDLNVMYCAEGIKNPSMKDASMMQHFGAPSPDILVEMLFGIEANIIAKKISDISGADMKEEKKKEEKVKNL